MNIKKTISKITSIAILSTSLISFIPINSYGVTYYSSDRNSSYNPYTTSYTATNSTVTRYYSRDNSTTSNLSNNNSVESNDSQPNSQTTSNRTTYYSSNTNTTQYSSRNYQNYRVSSSGSVTRYYSNNTQSNNTTNVSKNQDTVNSNTTEASNANTNSTSTGNISASFTADVETQKMLSLINQERTNKGLKTLILDEKLTSVAELKAKDMVENNYLSHTSATYGSIYTMIKNAGISYYNAGENIARAFSVQSAHNNFMNSYMHKRAILADHFTHVGIGIEKEKSGMYKISVMFIEEK